MTRPSSVTDSHTASPSPAPAVVTAHMPASDHDGRRLAENPSPEHSQARAGAGAEKGGDTKAADRKNSSQQDHSTSVTSTQQGSSITDRGKDDDADTDDGVLWVDWNGPNDPENPRNWTSRQKWIITFVVSSFTFISPVSSSMVAPAGEQIATQFGIHSSVTVAMATSVFILGYAIGPLVIGPLSEIYGRSRVLQWTNLFYLAWNTGCGFAQNTGQLIAFRFLAGVGGSAPLSIGGGTLGDVWPAEKRGQAVAIYSLAPLLGPVVGPVCGGWIAERSTWRWVFWATSIVDGLIQLSGIFFLKETYAPYLLEKKAERVRKELAVAGGKPRPVMTIYETSAKRSWQNIFKNALTRPFQLLYHEPIIQLLGLYMTFVYGVLYLFLTTMPAIFGGIYNEEVGIAGLHYIALGLGLALAAQVNARFMDRIYVYYKNKNGGVGEPEFRLLTMVPGTILLPFGLLLSGWAAQNRLHWIATDIGIFFVGGAVVIANQSIQTYVIDAFTLHAASALASVTCSRSLAGFGFPLFAPAMYDKLGYGKGDTILAALSIGIGCPAPILLWKYGRRIRLGSKYAQKTHVRQTANAATEEKKGELKV